MRYPTLSETDILIFIKLAKDNPAIVTSTESAGFADSRARFAVTPGDLDGRLVNLDAIDKLSQEISKFLAKPTSESASDAAKEHYEGEISGLVHAALEPLPYELLDDKGFWQYLAIRYFCELILWRQATVKEEGPLENYLIARRQDSMPLRMYLRARAIHEATGSYALTTALPKSSDFWKSHILRVRTGRARGLVESFVVMQRDHRLPTGQVRRLAKLFNRMWSNVVLFEYDRASADVLVNELRDRVLTSKE